MYPTKFLIIGSITITLMVSCNSKLSEKAGTLSDDSIVAKSAGSSARPVHWSYVKDGGPAGWAELSPVYALCGCGKTQSPVNLLSAAGKEVAEWEINYNKTPLAIGHNQHVEELIDNGHTIQITPQKGSSIVSEGKIYHLKQFHFHSPSEHTIDGKHFPMEIHLVHLADDTSLAVIGVLVQEGDHNPNFDQLIEHLPDTAGEQKTRDDVNIDIGMNIPRDLYAYHYIGSLTTPPCYEQVQWLVMQKPITISGKQLAAFSSRLKKNNRPVQVMNGRTPGIVHLISKSSIPQTNIK